MGSFASTSAKENQANNIGSTGAQTNYNFSDLTLAGWGSSNATSVGGTGVGGTGGGGSGGSTSGQDLFNNTGIILNSSDLGAIEAGSEIIALGMNFVSEAFDDLLASQDRNLQGVSNTVSTLTENTRELNRPANSLDIQKVLLFLAVAGAAVYLIPKVMK